MMHFLKVCLFSVIVFFFPGTTGVLLNQDDLRMVCQSFQKSGKMNEALELLREELSQREVSAQEFNRNLPILKQIVASLTEDPSKSAIFKAKPMNTGATSSSIGPSVTLGAQPGFKLEVTYPIVMNMLMIGGNSTIETMEMNSTKPTKPIGQTAPKPTHGSGKVETIENTPVQPSVEESDFNLPEDEEEEEEEKEEEIKTEIVESAQNQPNSFFQSIPRPVINGSIFNWSIPENNNALPSSFFTNMASGQAWKPPSFAGLTGNMPNGRLESLGPLLATFFSGLKNSCYKLKFPVTIETEDPKQLLDLLKSLAEQKREILATYVEHRKMN
ncbi:uncharacterized protein LOC141856819 [Brevipalpus obovatus]|uniref:uncharacterized protein LOC141856819 n=1 Tax=Brevipalpus obovatus TaxID=246614 RepID=UPI003D9E1B45